MKLKTLQFVFLNLILSFQSSCFNSSVKNTESLSIEVGKGFNSIVSTKPTKLSKSSKYSIYKSLITYIAKELDYPRNKVDYVLIYRTETIKPQNIENLKGNSLIKPELLDNFIKSNQNTESLEKNYDILTASVDSNSGNRDLIKFYESTKTKYSDTTAVVAFSNTGVDDEQKEGLIYVELYNSNKKLRKMYLSMKFYKDEHNYDPDEIQGILDINQILILE